MHPSCANTRRSPLQLISHVGHSIRYPYSLITVAASAAIDSELKQHRRPHRQWRRCSSSSGKNISTLALHRLRASNFLWYVKISVLSALLSVLNFMNAWSKHGWHCFCWFLLVIDLWLYPFWTPMKISSLIRGRYHCRWRDSRFDARQPAHGKPQDYSRRPGSCKSSTCCNLVIELKLRRAKIVSMISMSWHPGLVFWRLETIHMIGWVKHILHLNCVLLLIRDFLLDFPNDPSGKAADACEVDSY